ncbi:MAG: hypothetical protein KGP28_01220 [Bdellovibrionales bacterium]|nr:hypothetical protein [Bdellovibrionales bacterium]
MKRSIQYLITLLALGMGLSACRSTTTVYQDPYYRAWYDVYGYYCGEGYPTAGCNFYADGSKILMSEDPYYRSGVTLYNDYWTYTDSFGYRRSYLGFAWLSPSGILYDQFGNALNEADADAISADVITAAAEREMEIQASAGRALAQKYALNEARGIEISKTLQDWAKLGKDRARTEADIVDFSKRLFGVSASRAESALAVAMTTRSLKAVEELNVDVAAYWGTTPEVSKQILHQWYRDEAKALGY